MMKKGKKLKREGKNTAGVLALLALSAVVSVIIASGIGPVSVSPGATLGILLSKLPFIGELIPGEWNEVTRNIVLHLRLPRALLGFVVGASLSVCGVAMQALVRNKLADPFILGVSSGASAFATFGMLFGAFSFFGIYSLSISAFLGAAVTIIAVYIISRTSGRINITWLLLSGVAVSMIMDGITSIIKLSSPNSLGLHNAEFWMSGSLAGARWEYLTLPTAVLILSVVFLLINYRGLNALLLGESSAITLGVNVKSLQKQLILCASVIAGACVSVSGSIGFVGLMMPHLARLLVGSDHRRLLPVSALLGGIFVVWADVAARMLVSPEELPVGVLTAVIGGPVFIIMLKRNGREGRMR